MGRGEPTVGVRHGTTPGWHRHRARGEPPCDACTAAKRDYDARRRGASSVLVKSRLRARAQRYALQRLRRLYPVIYQLLYEEEKRRVEREEEGHDPDR